MYVVSNMPESKLCKYHNIEHPIDQFRRQKAKNGVFYYHPHCIEAGRIIARENRKRRYRDSETQDIIKQQNKAYRDKPERLAISREKSGKYYESNKATIKARTKAYRQQPLNRARRNALWRKNYSLNREDHRAEFKKKYYEDPAFRLRGSIRSRVWEALRKSNGNKDRSILKALPYSIEQLKFHVESQFQTGMDWSTPRSFSIDHIVPQVMFPYSSVTDEDFRLCWSLDNLRPLTLSQNASEGDREYAFNGYRTFQDLVAWIRLSPLGSPPESLSDVIPRLSGLDLTDSVPLINTGLGFLDSHFSHRFRSNTKGKLSLVDAYNDNFQLLKVISYIVRSGRRVDPHLVYRNMSFVHKTPSHFFPSAASAIVRRYAVGRDVLDPFIGWGGRALGALCGGARSYTGTDLQKESVDGCSSMMGNGMDINVYHADFRQFFQESSRKFDFLFTSPPFADSEDYGVGAESNMLDWTKTILYPLIVRSREIIRPDGKIGIHIQDTKRLPLMSLTHQSMLSSGFILKDEYLYGRKTNQKVLIYGFN